jgi:hypothetical protein
MSVPEGVFGGSFVTHVYSNENRSKNTDPKCDRLRRALRSHFRRQHFAIGLLPGESQ